MPVTECIAVYIRLSSEDNDVRIYQKTGRIY